MAHYNAREKRELQGRIARGDVAPPCPRCGGPCAVVRGGPRRDVPYVRNRVVARCGACRCSVAVESGGRGAWDGAAQALAGWALAAAAWAAPSPAWGQSSAEAATSCGSREGPAACAPAPGAQGWAVSTAGVAFGHPFAAGDGEAAVGATPLALELPVGARAVALGGAFWTSGADAGAIFHHPSLLAGASFGATYQRFRAPSASAGAVSFLSAAGSGEWLGGVAGVGVAFVEHGARGDAHGAWPGAAAEPGSGAEAAASAYVASVGFARELAGFTVGGAAKVVGLRVGAAKGSTGAVDLGASREVGAATVALTLQNVGPDLQMGGEDGRTAPLAARVVVGIGAGRTPVGPLDVGGAVQAVRTGGGEVAAGGGVEVAWWPVLRRVFVARAGLARVPDQVHGAFHEISLGGGFEGDRIRLDYAYRRHGPREDGRAPATVSHTFGISFR